MALTVDIKRRLKEFSLDISFHSEKGCTGILGASGCGKSMTLRTIAGITNPDSGRILLNDNVFYDSKQRINLKPQKRRVGFLFQNYALFPNMTVEENVGAGLLKKTPQNQEKVENALRRFHLTGLEKRYPKMLSGGQQQRVALARILVCKPDLLLLDEPFSALDAYLKEELQVELKETIKEYDGNTILVTHDRDEAYKLCDNLIIMDKGKVIAHGRTEDMFHKPLNYQTARLTGCKNLSKARKIDDHTVYAIDWETELKVSSRIPEGLNYIGIRAHDFIPLDNREGQINCIELIHPKIVDSPFELNLIFDTPSGAHIWYKIGQKNVDHTNNIQIPHYLKVNPEQIMLLE